jgi:hypothetical protein
MYIEMEYNQLFLNVCKIYWRLLNITVHYSMQLGEIKSICGTHVQSQTLDIEAPIRTRVSHTGPYWPVYRDFWGYRAGPVAKLAGIPLSNRT